MSGLSKSGVHSGRKKLVEHGLIKCTPGEKGKAPIYEMLSLVQNIDRTEHLSEDRSEHPSEAEPGTIHKHKQNKERREEDGTDCNLVTTYEENIGKLSPITKTEFIKWLEIFGEDVMLEAIKVTCKYDGRTFRYLEKILMEWREAKLATVKAIKLYDEKKGKPKENMIPFRKSPHKRSIFDELREEAGG